jgi:hypothetical protein
MAATATTRFAYHRKTVSEARVMLKKMRPTDKPVSGLDKTVADIASSLSELPENSIVIAISEAGIFGFLKSDWK